MIPAGLRLQCPECTFSTVVTEAITADEFGLPEGVTRRELTTFYCPNCTSIALAPVASVDPTPKPKTGITHAMTVDECAAKVAEIGRDVEVLADALEDAKREHADAKKAYDAKVITLRVAVERLGRVCEGEQVAAEDKPLLDLAEQPEPSDAQGAAAVQDVVRQAAEAFRQRLAALQLVVETDAIEAWSLEAYDRVRLYVERLEAGEVLVNERPTDLLPEDPPEHVTALHRALGQVGVVMAFAAVCAWTPAEREAAAAWAAAEIEQADSADRPAHVPAPAHAERTISRRGPVEDAETLANA